VCQKQGGRATLPTRICLQSTEEDSGCAKEKPRLFRRFPEKDGKLDNESRQKGKLHLRDVPLKHDRVPTSVAYPLAAFVGYAL
jgi:hypothetical protein